MIFAPFGNFYKEVPDPERLRKEFLEAARVTGRTTQWAWAAQAFPDIAVMERGGPVAFDMVSQECDLNTTQGVSPQLPDDAGADANLWVIPYNRGLDVVGNDAGTEMHLEFSTAMPALLFAVFDAQYVRKDVSDLAWWNTWSTFTWSLPRIQWGLRLDGSVLPGSGPLPYTSTGVFRGSGVGEKSVAACAFACTILPPGSHILEAVGGQTSAMPDGWSDDPALTGFEQLMADGPGSGICIGSRKLFYILLPLTAWLGV